MNGSLYARLLASEWPQLAEAIRLLHGEASRRAYGRVRVVNGRGALARAVTRVCRTPHARDSADLRLEVVRDEDGETWRRTFDGERLDTWQHEAAPGVLAERFGILEFQLRLTTAEGSLRFTSTNASIRLGRIRLSLPAPFAPRIEAAECAVGPACLRVRVLVTWPPAGEILEYDGDVHLEDRFQ